MHGYHYGSSQPSLISPQIVQPGLRRGSYIGDQSFLPSSLQPNTTQERNHLYDPPNGAGHIPQVAHIPNPRIAKGDKVFDHLEPISDTDRSSNTNNVPAFTGRTQDLTSLGTSPERHSFYMQYGTDQTSARQVYNQNAAVTSQHLHVGHGSQRAPEYLYETFPIDPQWPVISPRLDLTRTNPNTAHYNELNAHNRTTYDDYTNTAGDIAGMCWQYHIFFNPLLLEKSLEAGQTVLEDSVVALMESWI